MLIADAKFSISYPIKQNESFWFSIKIIISMIPAAIIGFFFKSEIDGLFNGNLTIVGSMLIVTGVLLLLADKAKISEKKINVCCKEWTKSIIIMRKNNKSIRLNEYVVMNVQRKKKKKMRINIYEKKR